MNFADSPHNLHSPYGSGPNMNGSTTSLGNANPVPRPFLNHRERRSSTMKPIAPHQLTDSLSYTLAMIDETLPPKRRAHKPQSIYGHPGNNRASSNTYYSNPDLMETPYIPPQQPQNNFYQHANSSSYSAGQYPPPTRHPHPGNHHYNQPPVGVPINGTMPRYGTGSNREVRYSNSSSHLYPQSPYGSQHHLPLSSSQEAVVPNDYKLYEPYKPPRPQHLEEHNLEAPKMPKNSSYHSDTFSFCSDKMLFSSDDSEVSNSSSSNSPLQSDDMEKSASESQQAERESDSDHEKALKEKDNIIAELRMELEALKSLMLSAEAEHQETKTQCMDLRKTLSEKESYNDELESNLASLRIKDEFLTDIASLLADKSALSHLPAEKLNETKAKFGASQKSQFPDLFEKISVAETHGPEFDLAPVVEQSAVFSPPPSVLSSPAKPMASPRFQYEQLSSVEIYREAYLSLLEKHNTMTVSCERRIRLLEEEKRLERRGLRTAKGRTNVKPMRIRLVETIPNRLYI